MTFIIHHPDGRREQYSNHYNEDIESERDALFNYKTRLLISKLVIIGITTFIIVSSLLSYIY